MIWWKRLKGKVKVREPLYKHTTFKIGGPASLFIEPRDIADLKVLIKEAKRDRIPLRVIGAGSNILAADDGIKAAAVHLKSPYFSGCSSENGILEAGAGCVLSRVIAESQSKGFSGLEFLAGIPGTIGGAVAMNAGAWGSNIGKKLRDVTVMDYHGTVNTLKRSEIKFHYRSCSLENSIILSVRFSLRKDNPSAIARRIAGYRKARKASQDLSAPSAGCVFKNPDGESAGRLIDLCGLKGKKIGGALVSSKHANFIINKKNASAGDVISLMGLLKESVQDKFKINLEPEIKIWK